MSECCPEFWYNPVAGVPDPPPDDPAVCSSGTCNCGYLQYEGLLNYLDELKDLIKPDPEKYIEFEFKLREKIIEISRLFDVDAGVAPGYFTKSHYVTTRIYTSNGTQYLRVPDFVKDTLEVRTLDNIVIDPSSYAYKDGYLVFLPCSVHVKCGCNYGCGNTKSKVALKWPKTCYKVTARWGKDCADPAVQMAIREYLIESYRMQDPVQVLASGLPIQRTFRVPHSWRTYIERFNAKRRIHSQWAIA